MTQQQCQLCHTYYKNWVDIIISNETNKEHANSIKQAIFTNCCKECSKTKLQIVATENQIQDYSRKINSLRKELKYYASLQKQEQKNLCELEWEITSKVEWI